MAIHGPIPVARRRSPAASPPLHPDAPPRTPDRKRDALACLDIHKERVIVGAERRTGELICEPGCPRDAVAETVQRDVEHLAAACQSADVVVAGTVFADDHGSTGTVSEVVGEVENGRAGRLEDTR